MKQVLIFLKENNIQYILHKHPAVFTCAEAELHTGNIPGLACKNLFLRNRKKSRYFLLVLPASMPTNLKAFGSAVGEKSISFASSDVLYEKLGLAPGSVSPFGLINDPKLSVELFIHPSISDAPIVTFHPNVNTATLELTQEMFRKYLDVIGHSANVAPTLT